MSRCQRGQTALSSTRGKDVISTTGCGAWRRHGWVVVERRFGHTTSGDMGASTWVGHRLRVMSSSKPRRQNMWVNTNATVRRRSQSNVGGDSASTWWVSTAFHSADERHDKVDFITTRRHLETNMNVSIGRLPIKCQNKTVLFGMSYCKWIILPNKCQTITCCKDSLFLKYSFFLPNTCQNKTVRVNGRRTDKIDYDFRPSSSRI